MKKFIIITLLPVLLLSELYQYDRNNIRINPDFNNRSISFNNSLQTEDELIQFIQSTMETHLIPGLSISIVKDSDIVWEKYFGYANIEQEILVDENTMFILSSISKTVTATALMQLYEDELFDLDDDINNYLPFSVNHPDYPLVPITFKMLLTHSSGIQDNWSIMPYYDGDSQLELSYYLNQYFTPGGEFYSGNLNFTNSMPGTNYRYTNIGAALIGLLVEEISNQLFNHYCNDNIFEPLSMDNTFWFLSEIDDLNQVASPYQVTGGSGDSCFIIGCGIYDQNNPCFCDSACIDYGDCCSDYEEICGENGSGSNPGNLTEYQNYGYSDYPSGQLRTTSNNLAKFVSAYMNDGIYNGSLSLPDGSYQYVIAGTGAGDNWSGWGTTINAPIHSECDFNPDDEWANYGFSFDYSGSGSGNNNTLIIRSDNQEAGSQVDAFTMLQDGTIGIKTASPDNTYVMDVNGHLRVTNFTNTSDSRFKTNVVTIDSKKSLDNINKLNPIYYEWVDEKKDDWGDEKQIGLIAQEVKDIIPEVVSTDNSGYHSISYNKLVTTLIGAVQEQQKEIDELKRIIEEKLK